MKRFEELNRRRASRVVALAERLGAADRYCHDNAIYLACVCVCAFVGGTLLIAWAIQVAVTPGATTLFFRLVLGG